MSTKPLEMWTTTSLRDSINRGVTRITSKGIRPYSLTSESKYRTPHLFNEKGLARTYKEMQNYLKENNIVQLTDEEQYKRLLIEAKSSGRFTYRGEIKAQATHAMNILYTFEKSGLITEEQLRKFEKLSNIEKIRRLKNIKPYADYVKNSGSTDKNIYYEQVIAILVDNNT